MVAQPTPAHLPSLEPEGRLLLPFVTWDSYLAISNALMASGSKAKLTYLEGQLEIMVTSRDHEVFKKLIGRLLEAWADERDVELEGYGGMTFKKRAAQRGLEPDECYSVGEMGSRPDIAIEVVVASPLLNKLEVYRGLRVGEVWVFDAKTRAITVNRLVGTKYRRDTSSTVLPTLDLAQLASFVRQDITQTASVRAYRQGLRSL